MSEYLIIVNTDRYPGFKPRIEKYVKETEKQVHTLSGDHLQKKPTVYRKDSVKYKKVDSKEEAIRQLELMENECYVPDEIAAYQMYLAIVEKRRGLVEEYVKDWDGL